VEAIVRRVLDGRVIRPVSDDGSGTLDESRTRDARAMLELGLNPVKGLLLYGPPGCGKTALAREISSRLDARPPKIVSAPELLDRWVGGSEKMVRSLFAEAELELKQCNGDTTKSALHVIVIDEIDAVFRKRSSAEDSGEVTRASAVNQILSMLDGVNSPGNILVIGMTNRRELLDEALLRPGRLEVQVNIPPPDRDSRREILQIHFEALRQKGRLSQPLCQAIDGARKDTDARRDEAGWIRTFKLSSRTPFSGSRIKDLAADQWTRGFSGADIAGLVRSSGSLALSRVRRNGEGIENLLITVEDVLEALREVKA
jgi:vesicle-fusing ATPase